MSAENDAATITIRLDQLIEALQGLLIAKADKCRQSINDSSEDPSQAWREERARQLFGEYANGVADSADQMGNSELLGILKAFASTEEASLSRPNPRGSGRDQGLH